MQILIIILTGLCLCSLVIFFFIIVQPAQHEKNYRRQWKTKEEIDDLFDTDDPFSATEVKGSDLN